MIRRRSRTCGESPMKSAYQKKKICMRECKEAVREVIELHQETPRKLKVDGGNRTSSTQEDRGGRSIFVMVLYPEHTQFTVSLIINQSRTTTHTKQKLYNSVLLFSTWRWFRQVKISHCCTIVSNRLPFYIGRGERNPGTCSATSRLRTSKLLLPILDPVLLPFLRFLAEYAFLRCVRHFLADDGW